MASPGQMVATVSEALAIPKATITVHDRNLSEAGLRTKGGRGRSAAKMTAMDTANLLIASLISRDVKDSVESVKVYGALTASGANPNTENEIEDFSEFKWNLPGFDLPLLKQLPREHSFSEALSALIESWKDGSLQRVIDATPIPEREIVIKDNWHIQVAIYGPSPGAQVTIALGGFWESVSYNDMPKHVPAPSLGADEATFAEYEKYHEQMDQYLSRDYGDREYEERFSKKTIIKMGDLLRE